MLRGIDSWGKDGLIGLGAGLTFILANSFGLFALALPPVLNAFSTNVGRFVAVVLLAPVVEEVIFRGILLSFAEQGLGKRFIISNAIQAIAFGGFHLVAYSGIFLEQFSLPNALIVGGAFLSAVVFGFAAGFLAKYTNNLLPSMIAHSMINFWMVQGALVIVA